MNDYLSLFVKSIFVDNMIFAYFLGMCFLPGGFEECENSIGIGYCSYFRVGCDASR
jgi:Na+-transporting NADH:ubiquinone oxidoreductase subunit E